MNEAAPLDPTLPDPAALAEALGRGERRALAQAITLVESSRPDHRPVADLLLEILLPRAGKSIRIGISGAPGVGKSTFIETFGLHVLSQGHRLAVLAVDPSSRLGGGSILGDKTRMTRLGREAAAFIRPSPAGETLGGVARRTREAMLLVEAAGHDVVLVETVGVGQSETAVADMTDMFLLLLLPGSGDDLQGIKRGIVELADLILVNKADGALKEVAARTATDYQHALRLLHSSTPGWTPEVRTCSALEGTGIAEAWSAIERFRASLGEAALAERRAAQAKAWLRAELSDSLLAALARHPAVRGRLPALEAEVAAGRLAPGAAARLLLAEFLKDPRPAGG
ncbi:MAG TPA: methylmalonyl Co-A mutase-associated GTPase MeaB [Dongiaceae bacterium]|nr:methylmalonyl Co-A mutase-associated GTPase MeaB [Dongiaceae bacterium]